MATSVRTATRERAPLLTAYRQLPLTVHILCGGSLINRAGSFIMVFLAVYVSGELKLGDTFATWCIGILGAGAILSSLIAGQLADQFGRRAIMLSALFGGAALLLVMSCMRDGWSFMVTLFLFALVMEMYRPASSAMIGDVVAPAERAHAFGLMYIAVNLGFAIAPPLGGWLVEAFSWNALFWGDAVTTAMYGIVVLVFIQESRHRSANHSPDPEMPAPLRGLEDFVAADDPRLRDEPPSGAASEVTVPAGSTARPVADDHVPLSAAVSIILKDYPFLAYCGCNVLTAMVFVQCFSTLPLYMKSLGYTESEYGRIVALNGIMIVVLQLPISHWLSRTNRVGVILIGEAFLACGFGLTTFARTTPMLLLTIAIWTLGEVIQAPFKQAIVADLAPPAVRARYMGVFGMSFSVAMMLGAPLGGLVFEHYGPDVLWPGCCCVVAAAMIIYGFAWRSLTARMAKRSPQ